MKNKKKVIYYDVLQYHEKNIQKLYKHFDIVILSDPSYDTPKILLEADMVFAPLGYSFDKEKINKCKSLKVIATNTTSISHVDVDVAISKNIYIASLKDELKFLDTITPTAEHTIGLMIACLRNYRSANMSVIGGKWNRRPFSAPFMLSRAYLGLIGLGRLGKMVSNYAKSFGMKIQYFDPYVRDDSLSRVNDIKELVSTSDIITVHVPSNKKTLNLLNADVLNSFKFGSYFINTSRAELVDEKALIKMLDSSRIKGAAIDVISHEFESDYDMKNHPLIAYAKEHDNLFITPHIGGSTIDAWSETEFRVIKMSIEYFERLENGE